MDISAQLKLLEMPSLKLIRDPNMGKDHIQCAKRSMNLGSTSLDCAHLQSLNQDTRLNNWGGLESVSR